MISSQNIGFERVTAVHAAGFEPFGEPADALFGGPMGEAVGYDVALGVFLDPVVADGCGALRTSSISPASSQSVSAE
jgi:hypothetical protein